MTSGSSAVGRTIKEGTNLCTYRTYAKQEARVGEKSTKLLGDALQTCPLNPHTRADTSVVAVVVL